MTNRVSDLKARNDRIIEGIQNDLRYQSNVKAEAHSKIIRLEGELRRRLALSDSLRVVAENTPDGEFAII